MRPTSRSKGSECTCTGRWTQPATPWSSCSVRPRDTQAAKGFLSKALGACHTTTPRVINVDQNPAYPRAFDELKKEGTLPQGCELRPVKYLNNVIEQDHRFIKRRVKPGLGFYSFQTAWRTLQGYETMHMIRKGQVQGSGIQEQVKFIDSLFGLAA